MSKKLSGESETKNKKSIGKHQFYIGRTGSGKKTTLFSSFLEPSKKN